MGFKLQIKGNTWKQLEKDGLEEKQTVPSQERSHTGLVRGRNWGQYWGRRQAVVQGAPQEVGTFHVVVTLGLGQRLGPDSVLPLPRHHEQTPLLPVRAPPHTHTS